MGETDRIWCAPEREKTPSSDQEPALCDIPSPRPTGEGEHERSKSQEEADPREQDSNGVERTARTGRLRKHCRYGSRLGLTPIAVSPPALREERVQEGQDRLYNMQVSAGAVVVFTISPLILSLRRAVHILAVVAPRQHRTLEPLLTSDFAGVRDRIRKVKCDEAKPFCMRCTRTGRRCDGYLDAKTMAQRRRRSAGPAHRGTGEPQTPLAVLYEWASSDERRAFHFFQHVTAPCLSGDLDGAFWRVLVLQICQSEPAVRHAVLAVSSLHEGMVQGTMMMPYVDGDGRASFALYQYNRAIACLLDQMRTVDARPLVPLLTCVLFVCIELMQSKDRDSLLHLAQGRQILSQLGRRPPAGNPEMDLIKQYLVPMYTRLSLTSLMIGGDPVAIPAPLKTLIEVPMVFETIDEIRYVLYDLMDECLRFAKKSHAAKIGEVSSEDMRVFENEQDYLLRKLAKFKVAFSLYQSAKAREAPPGAIALIQIHVHTTFIWISTALSQHETVFDDYVDTFSAIIPLATEFIDTLAPAPASRDQPGPGRPTGTAPSTADTRRLSAMFTFEMHIIAPLYFVAAKCRHPVIRRAALKLLRRNPARRENLWRANIMAAIGEKTMRLEEKHLRPPPTEGQSQSRSASPPELTAPFPYPFGPGDGWGSSLPDVPFPDSFLGPDLGQLGVGVNSGQPMGSFDVSRNPPVTNSRSSSATTDSMDVSRMDNLGGTLSNHMPIDPNLFFDATEVSSAAHSFSVAPSIVSSLEDLGGITAPSTGPYPGGITAVAATTTEQHPSQMWSGERSSHQTPGIAFEPPTPIDESMFGMPPPLPSPQPYSQPRSRPQSRQASRSSPSLRSDMDSPTLHAVMELRETGTEVDMGMDTLSHLRHHHQHQQQQQQENAGGTRLGMRSMGLGNLNLGLGLGWDILGQMSPTAAVPRSGDAPFDVPERFRVHESIIGPDKEDGTSWVMMFRKLGGLDAEWDVSTEFVAVT